MTHPLAALIAGVKVKPLEWFEAELPSRGGGKYTADGYTLRRIEGLWLLDFAGNGKTAWRWADLEAAKAAAQADYESRILAALEAAPVPDLAEAVKVLEGVTGDEWLRGVSVGAWKVVRNRDKTLNVVSGPDDDGDTHKVCLVNGADEANARFIAWCREGVPALIALATAQAAQIAGLTKERDDLQEKMKLERLLTDRATILAGATQDEAATLRAEVERLRGILCLADEALMQSHGCFPLDRTNERQIFLNDACTAIRKVTGDDYAERKRRARAALEGKANE